jgi:glycosyltransferase involved in cell wall biosynthesis
MSSSKLSLIITVYNKPQLLRFVLAACSRQSFKDFEILIADDGSGPEIKEVINDAISKYSLSIIHCRHERNGWQKNKILNEAVRTSHTEYLVFMDGDCIPTKHFLHDHWEQRQENRTLWGRRVELSAQWSDALTVEKILKGTFEKITSREIINGIKGISKRLEDGIRIKSNFLRTILRRRTRGMLGCNFSLYKKDLLRINGFDELYNGPGFGEDSDVEYRLSLIGVKGKSLRNLAIQFHIYHPHTITSKATQQRFERVITQGNPLCEFGITKQTAASENNF